jgi:hypothetical protein
MDCVGAALETANVEIRSAEIDLRPFQAHQLAHPQAMPIADQDHGRVAVAVPVRVGSLTLDRHAHGLDGQLERLQKKLPGPVARSIQWLRQPSSRWVRFPAGVLLVIGGLFSFLPILGLWMIPFGLLLLAQDVPFLRGPLNRTLAWFEAVGPNGRSATASGQRLSCDTPTLPGPIWRRAISSAAGSGIRMARTSALSKGSGNGQF